MPGGRASGLRGMGNGPFRRKGPFPRGDGLGAAGENRIYAFRGAAAGRSPARMAACPVCSRYLLMR